AFALAALVGPRDRLHALEHAGHRLGFVTAAGQGADADAVGFRLVGAGVVDLALRRQALGAGDRRHGRVVGGIAAGRLRDRDRAEHGEQVRNAVALGALDAAQYVRLGDVGDLVPEHRGHL